MYRIVTEDHPPLPEGISPLLSDFLLKCLVKDAVQRSSAAMLLEHPWLASALSTSKLQTSRDFVDRDMDEDAAGTPLPPPPSHRRSSRTQYEAWDGALPSSRTTASDMSMDASSAVFDASRLKRDVSVSSQSSILDSFRRNGTLIVAQEPQASISAENSLRRSSFPLRLSSSSPCLLDLASTSPSRSEKMWQPDSVKAETPVSRQLHSQPSLFEIDCINKLISPSMDSNDSTSRQHLGVSLAFVLIRIALVYFLTHSIFLV